MKCFSHLLQAGVVESMNGFVEKFMNQEEEREGILSQAEAEAESQAER